MAAPIATAVRRLGASRSLRASRKRLMPRLDGGARKIASAADRCGGPADGGPSRRRRHRPGHAPVSRARPPTVHRHQVDVRAALPLGRRSGQLAAQDLLREVIAARGGVVLGTGRDWAANQPAPARHCRLRHLFVTLAGRPGRRLRVGRDRTSCACGQLPMREQDGASCAGANPSLQTDSATHMSASLWSARKVRPASD